MPHDMDLWEDPFLRDLEAELAEPFQSDQVHWRVGSTNKKAFDSNRAKERKGKPLAYIDARDVMERLDGIMGVANWQDEYINAGNGKTCCRIGLYLDGHWIWKSDGAGDTNMEGDKGAFSDAFKRAAVRWGVGRYLYGLDAAWLTLDERWRIQKDDHKKLASIHDQHAAKVGMGSPSERAAIKVLCQTIRTTVSNEDEKQAWIENNKGVLTQLRASQKGEVWTVLQHIGREAA